MKNVVIIGACCIGKAEIMEKLIELASLNNLPVVFFTEENGISAIAKQQIELAIIENKKQIEEIRNVAFKPEPMMISNDRLEWTEPKVYNNIPRNKFIDKPLHNFKKR